LDVNIGGFDQYLMAEIFEALQTAVQVPLFIDSQDPATIEEALKVYGGKAVINSVSAREDMCSKILPIARRYGAAVIGLTMDEQGIPETPETRLDVARKVVKLAESYGIRACDVIIDSLVLPAGASENSAITTTETLRRIKQELGVATILGISNVSYGMPVREHINQAFLMSTIQAGLDAAIIDPHEAGIMELVAASELLSGRDPQGQRYISKHATTVGVVSELPLHAVQKAILSGNKDETTKQVNELLQSNELPLKIINEFLVPAMEEAGEKYEKKEFFLPQLIGASEAMKQGIGVLIPLLGKGKSTGKKVLLATVEGDMHDLGKNLVKVILEANGYVVTDLGKDVKPDQIVETCKADLPDVIGLSCLMTTTLPSLQEAVESLRNEEIGAKIVVGGASVEEEFAKQLGVLYAKDAIAAVKLLKSL
jgi:5-methyltetrahydrofolate--homocysteine methyltransferase